jgi:hypothetical protein
LCGGPVNGFCQIKDTSALMLAKIRPGMQLLQAHQSGVLGCGIPNQPLGTIQGGGQAAMPGLLDSSDL